MEATGITLAFAGAGRGAMDPVQGQGVEVVNITPMRKLCARRFIARGGLGISLVREGDKCDCFVCFDSRLLGATSIIYYIYIYSPINPLYLP